MWVKIWARGYKAFLSAISNSNCDSVLNSNSGSTQRGYKFSQHGFMLRFEQEVVLSWVRSEPCLKPYSTLSWLLKTAHKSTFPTCNLCEIYFKNSVTYFSIHCDTPFHWTSWHDVSVLVEAPPRDVHKLFLTTVNSYTQFYCINSLNHDSNKTQQD